MKNSLTCAFLCCTALTALLFETEPKCVHLKAADYNWHKKEKVIYTLELGRHLGIHCVQKVRPDHQSIITHFVWDDGQKSQEKLSKENNVFVGFIRVTLEFRTTDGTGYHQRLRLRNLKISQGKASWLVSSWNLRCNFEFHVHAFLTAPFFFCSSYWVTFRLQRP